MFYLCLVKQILCILRSFLNLIEMQKNVGLNAYQVNNSSLLERQLNFWSVYFGLGKHLKLLKVDLMLLEIL